VEQYLHRCNAHGHDARCKARLAVPRSARLAKAALHGGTVFGVMAGASRITWSGYGHF